MFVNSHAGTKAVDEDDANPDRGFGLMGMSYLRMPLLSLTPKHARETSVSPIQQSFSSFMHNSTGKPVIYPTNVGKAVILLIFVRGDKPE